MASVPSLIVQLTHDTYILNECLSFRFEKERYSPSTVLTGKWYCKQDEFDDVISLSLMIDGKMLHVGYPTSGCEVMYENGRRVLKVNSRGYTQALALNQPTPGLQFDIDLETLATSAVVCPGVSYQQNTPVVKYVNYYDGTSIWDAIVCYSIRATGTYPYIRGANTVSISTTPSDIGVVNVFPTNLISFGSGSDYSSLISEISESDADGTYATFVAQNEEAISKNIIRKKEIPFNYEWIMDSELGLQSMLNYSMRGMCYDKIKFFGYSGGDLLDYVAINYTNRLPYIGKISRLVLEGSQGNIITTVHCYRDAYCDN
ncbi:MAG: hypothetical protein IJ424_07400 [Oscillospiraceae bacterium]|nr:hypothetical protein [Oscillospiraceae bacterium]